MPPKKKAGKNMSLLKEQRDKAVYVRLPHRIKCKEEIEKLFVGDFKVKLFRQASRHCCVVFSSVEEKIKNMEAAKDKEVDGKRIVITPVPRTVEKPVTTPVVKKKVVMPDIEEDPKITQKLFISNIKCGTKTMEIKEALEGCVGVTLLKPYSHNFRSALAKIENIKIAADYLTKVKEWPIVRGHRLILKPDTRVKHKKTKARFASNQIVKNETKGKIDKKEKKQKMVVKSEASQEQNESVKSQAEPKAETQEIKVECSPVKAPRTEVKLKSKLSKIQNNKIRKKSVLGKKTKHTKVLKKVQKEKL